MVHIVDDSNFEQEVLKETKTVLVDFWAEWCGPCRQLTPVVEEIAKELGDSLKVCKANVDDSPETSAKYGIRSIPTLILFKDGAAFATKVGGSSKSVLLEWIKANQ